LQWIPLVLGRGDIPAVLGVLDEDIDWNALGVPFEPA
jgi:hypothetical protein